MTNATVTAAFPAAIISTTELPFVGNDGGSGLTADVTATALSLPVQDITDYTVPCIVRLGQERVLVTSKTSVPVVGNPLAGTLNVAQLSHRGYDSSTAASHKSGTIARLSFVAYLHNRIQAELIAIETRLGTTATAGTPGSVIFVGATGAFAQDNTSLFFDDAANELRVANLDVTTGVLQVGGVDLFENDRDLAVSLIPNASGTLDLGSATREFRHAYFADAGRIYFGTDQDLSIGWASSAFGGYFIDAQGHYVIPPSVTDVAQAINSAVSDLPASGGTIDARGVTGAVTLTTSINVGSVTKAVTLLLGAVTLTSTGTAAVIYPNSRLVGLGRGISTIKLGNNAAASTALVRNNDVGADLNGSTIAAPGDQRLQVIGVTLDGNKANQANANISLLRWRGVDYGLVQGCEFINAKDMAFDGCNNIDHCWVVDNLFRNNEGHDIAIRWVSNRNHVERNTIIGKTIAAADGGEGAVSAETGTGIFLSGVNVTGSVEFNANENVFANNVIKGKLRGIVVEGCFENEVKGNILGGQQAEEILLKSGTVVAYPPQGNIVEGNIITSDSHTSSVAVISTVGQGNAIRGNQVKASGTITAIVLVDAGANVADIIVEDNHLEYTSLQDVGLGIRIRDGVGFRVVGNYVRYARVAIQLDTPSASNTLASLLVATNQLHDSNREAIYCSNGGAGQTLRHLAIRGNHIRNNGARAANTHDAITVEHVAGGTVDVVLIEDNEVYDAATNPRDAVRLIGTVTNHQVRLNRGVGINGSYVTGATQYLTLTSTGALDVSGGLIIAGTTVFESDRDLAIALVPNADNTLAAGTAARRFTDFIGIQHSIYAAASDANPAWRVTSAGEFFGAGGASALDSLIKRSAAAAFQLRNAADSAYASLDILSLSVGGTSVFESDRDLAVSLIPNADNTLTSGTTARRWSAVEAVLQNVRAAASDTNPTAQLLSTGVKFGTNSADNLSVYLFAGAADRLDLNSGDSLNIVLGNLQMAGTTLFESDRDLAVALIPNADGTLNLGSSTRRFGVLYLNSAASVAGFTYQAELADSTALGVGVGGYLTFAGFYTAGAQTTFAGIKAYKETATSGETGGALKLYVRENGGGMLEVASLASDRSLDIVAGALKVSGTTLFESDRDLAVSLLPNANNTLALGSSTRGFATLFLGATAPTAANTGQVGYANGGLQVADGSVLQTLLQIDANVATETTLTDNTNRTPSATRPVMVVVIADVNTMAAATQYTYTVTVGGTTYTGAVVQRNFDAITARRMTSIIWAGIVPPNTAYKVDADTTTNLTLLAKETLL